jgi:hypothetical protein
MRVGPGGRLDGKLGAKQMNFMASISKPASSAIEVSFGPALVIQSLMSERNFHEITILAFDVARRESGKIQLPFKTISRTPRLTLVIKRHTPEIGKERNAANTSEDQNVPIRKA